MGEMYDNPDHVRLLESWMKCYRSEELFDEKGRLRPELAAAADARWMSVNPHANGGALLRELKLPDFRDYAVEAPSPGGRRRWRSLSPTRSISVTKTSRRRPPIGCSGIRLFPKTT
jgi:xylulose-5-phosphate/fructose-6-phosphate phosphoketolase